MSAEVSFTKRAAAELSRCFNGLTSANRNNSNNNNNSNVTSNSSSAASSPSHSSSSSSAATAAAAAVGSKNKTSNSVTSVNSANNHQNEEETSETTLLLPSSKQQSHDSSTNNRISLGNISILNTSSRNNRKSDHTSQSSSSSTSSSPSLSSHISFHNSVQTLITKANTTLSPLTHHRECNAASSVKSNTILQQINCSTSTSSSVSSASSGINSSGSFLASFSSSSSASVCKQSSISVKSPAKRSIGTIARAGAMAVNATPPTPPRKTSLARRKNFMLNLSKARTLEELSKDASFLSSFFKFFSPKERTVLAQVCSHWRDLLYNDTHYWCGLIMVINCNDLRRCSPINISNGLTSSFNNDDSSSSTPVCSSNANKCNSVQMSINSVCNEEKNFSTSNNGAQQKKIDLTKGNNRNISMNSLSPTPGKVSLRDLLYSTIEKRGIDSVSLIGPCDADVIDFASKVAPVKMKRIKYTSLRSASISDKGLEIFLAALNQSLVSLELIGCNEISDTGLWTSLVPSLQMLTIMDCINVADETVAAVAQMLPSLKEFNLQAYHVTDSAMSYFGPTASRNNLRVLRLEHCWEIGNQGILSIAHGLPNLTTLSLCGCSKITDDAVEVIAEQLRHLKSLNLSWCPRISDASLEYIACDLSDSLVELNLDRCIHITDIGLGYAATMAKLSSLSLRWCPQIRDFGIQTLCSMKSLSSLALAGCPQLTVNGLSCLAQMHNVKELELTNCPAATPELIRYLYEHMPSETDIII